LTDQPGYKFREVYGSAAISGSKVFRVVGAVRGFRLKRDRRDALSYVLRSVRSLAADESVSIGFHPWLIENVSGESPDMTGGVSFVTRSGRILVSDRATLRRAVMVFGSC